MYINLIILSSIRNKSYFSRNNGSKPDDDIQLHLYLHFKAQRNNIFWRDYPQPFRNKINDICYQLFKNSPSSIIRFFNSIFDFIFLCSFSSTVFDAFIYFIFLIFDGFFLLCTTNLFYFFNYCFAAMIFFMRFTRKYFNLL